MYNHTKSIYNIESKEWNALIEEVRNIIILKDYKKDINLLMKAVFVII